MLGFFRRCLMLNRALISILNEVLGVYGLSYAQWTVIFYVNEHGASMLMDISKHINVSKPVITRIVQKLENNGIVQQMPGPDKREKIIELTEKGKGIYRECRVIIDKLEREVLESIPEAEKRAAFAVLHKVRDIILNR